MAKKLSHITNPLSGYLREHYPNGKVCSQPFSRTNNGLQCPEIMLFAMSCGEALLQLSFAEYLKQKNLDNAMTAYGLQQRLIADKKPISDYVKASGIGDYFIKGVTTVESEDIMSFYYQIYCTVLWDAKQRGAKQVVKAMTTGYINHYLPALFPKQVKTVDVSLLKKRIAAAISTQWQQRPVIKESFQATENQVRFSLLAVIPKAEPVLLHAEIGARLKPTRLKAYQTTLDMLDSGELILEPLTQKKVASSSFCKGK